MATASTPRTRDFLSADGLIGIIRQRFEQIIDNRREASIVFPLSDVLMSAFAMFSLKDPSLLAFDDRFGDESLRTLYQIKQVPSDTQMREVLDPIDFTPLNECFADIFAEVQRGGGLTRFLFDRDTYLVALDGTEHFCSTKISCPHCLQRKLANGEIQYFHQAVVASLVHPSLKEVIPLGIEPIVRKDGDTKNDCERNASRRLLQRLRQQHPQLKITILEDGLSSNAPHIQDLQELRFDFILGAKPGDHQHLFEQYAEAFDTKSVLSAQGVDPKTKATWGTDYVEDLALNASHPDLRVNLLVHHECDVQGNIRRQFSWVMSRKLSSEKLGPYVAGGRSRWKIENETFNTLKNQGYQFEHNYGHGQQHLCTVLSILMLLAFLVDQVQQLYCPLFQAVEKKLRTHRALWDNLRSHFRHFHFESFRQLWTIILTGRGLNMKPP